MTDYYLTGKDAAALLGISRRTLYRWIEEGRIDRTEWARGRLVGNELTKRQRGPQANPQAKRYTIGRHTFKGASK